MTKIYFCDKNPLFSRVTLVVGQIPLLSLIPLLSSLIRELKIGAANKGRHLDNFATKGTFQE